MIYVKTVWKNGDIIAADKLNKIENGLHGLSIALDDYRDLQIAFASGESQTNDGERINIRILSNKGDLEPENFVLGRYKWSYYKGIHSKPWGPKHKWRNGYFAMRNRPVVETKAGTFLYDLTFVRTKSGGDGSHSNRFNADFPGNKFYIRYRVPYKNINGKICYDYLPAQIALRISTSVNHNTTRIKSE
nr:MAG TPA: hypothetical protein [Caudoviricetes sp.]